MAIDDLRIDAINFQDGFEAPDPDDGLDRRRLAAQRQPPAQQNLAASPCRRPTPAWKFPAAYDRTGRHDCRSAAGRGGRPYRHLANCARSRDSQTDYSLAVNLLDADGEAIVIDRDCKVTTTTGLNFRDAPNGSKIGLIPQGTAVWALDSSEGWFNVEYDGLSGWIHGGYVTTEAVASKSGGA